MYVLFTDYEIMSGYDIVVSVTTDCCSGSPQYCWKEVLVYLKHMRTKAGSGNTCGLVFSPSYQIAVRIKVWVVFERLKICFRVIKRFSLDASVISSARLVLFDISLKRAFFASTSAILRKKDKKKP